MTFSGLAVAVLLSAAPAGDAAAREPPSAAPYLTVGLSVGTAAGLAVGLLAAHNGLLLGDGGGFLDLRPLWTPIVFAVVGAGVGTLVGWTLFQLHLADFNQWQRDQVTIGIAPDARGAWALTLARRW